MSKEKPTVYLNESFIAPTPPKTTPLVRKSDCAVPQSAPTKKAA